jgi:hypothetical protein
MLLYLLNKTQLTLDDRRTMIISIVSCASHIRFNIYPYPLSLTALTLYLHKRNARDTSPASGGNINLPRS